MILYDVCVCNDTIKILKLNLKEVVYTHHWNSKYGGTFRWYKTLSQCHSLAAVMTLVRPWGVLGGKSS